jgi:hypothetical protein
MIDGVDWMMPSNLPYSAKDYITEKLMKINHTFVPRALEAMNKSGDVNRFLQNDKQLNALRKETWFEHNPELYMLLKDLYE